MSHRLDSPRLLFEVLVAVVLSDLLVMFALPLVAPGLTGTTEALLKAALLAALATPMVLWRCVAAYRGTATPESVVRGD